MSNQFEYTESQKDVIANIISLNPTGKIDFSGIFKPKGQTSEVKNSYNVSKENLKRTNNNQFVCDNIEQFKNYGQYQKKMLASNIIHYILYFLIALLIVIILFGLYKMFFI